MFNNFGIFAIPALTAFLLAYLATPVVIRFAKKIDIIDDPKKNIHPKVIHTYPIPRGGGIAVYISLLFASLIFLPIDKHLIGILLGASLIVLIGTLDDKFNLNPYLRIGFQFLAALMPIAAGIGISFLTNPINGVFDLSHPQISFSILGNFKSIWLLADVFALFWIVLLMNFINMGAKGVDGQLPGVTGIAAVTIAILSLKYSADITQWPVVILAGITAGAFFGFLPYNSFPQKILASFSGSNLAGYLLGILSILSTTKVGTLLVVLGIPIIDTTYTVIRRVLSGKSPVWGDRGHLHHKLLDLGLSKKQVTYFYWITTALLGFLALKLNASNKLYTIVGVAIAIGGFLLLFNYRSQKK